MSLLSLENTTKTFPTAEIGPFNFAIDKPGAWSLTGESGVGKSTLLNLIGCLDTPSAGKIIIQDRDVSQLNDAELSEIRLRHIGFVHQFFDLMPDISAKENVLVPLWLSGADRAEQRAEECLERVAMIDSRDQPTRELSWGQKQRVAIARAIALQPPLILADEPTGSLDRKNSDMVTELLLDLQAALGNLLIVATHNQRIAKMMPHSVHINEHGSATVEGVL